jgi:hypothetical protein
MDQNKNIRIKKNKVGGLSINSTALFWLGCILVVLFLLFGA